MNLNSCIYLRRFKEEVRSIGTKLSVYILYDVYSASNCKTDDYKINTIYDFVEIWVHNDKITYVDNYEEIEKMVEGVSLEFKSD